MATTKRRLREAGVLAAALVTALGATPAFATEPFDGDVEITEARPIVERLAEPDSAYGVEIDLRNHGRRGTDVVIAHANREGRVVQGGRRTVEAGQALTLRIWIRVPAREVEDGAFETRLFVASPEAPMHAPYEVQLLRDRNLENHVRTYRVRVRENADETEGERR